MTCFRCGKAITPEMEVCPQCGVSLIREEPVQPAFNMQKVLRKMAESPLYLASIIIYTLSVLLGMFNMGEGTSILDIRLDRLSDWADWEIYLADFLEITDRLSEGAPAYALAGMLPEVMLCAAMWIMLFTMMNEERVTVGLTFARIAMILGLVWYGLILLVFEVLILIVGIGMAGDAFGSEIALVLLALAAAVLLTAAWCLANGLYRLSVLKALRAIKQTVQTGEALPAAGKILLIACWAASVCTIISSVAAGKALALISGILGAAAWISFSIFLIRYNAKMKEVEQALAAESTDA